MSKRILWIIGGLSVLVIVGIGFSYFSLKGRDIQAVRSQQDLMPKQQSPQSPIIPEQQEVQQEVQKEVQKTHTLKDKSYTFSVPNGWSIMDEKVENALGENGLGESATVRLSDARGNLIDLDINQGLGGACGVFGSKNTSKQYDFKGKNGSFTVCDYDFHWETLNSSVGIAGKFTFKSSDLKEQKSIAETFLLEFGAVNNHENKY